MDDPILIAKLASKIQIPRDGNDLLLGFNEAYIERYTGVARPKERAQSDAYGRQPVEYWQEMVDWTIKAEAALRVMLAKEILNAAHK